MTEIAKLDQQRITAWREDNETLRRQRIEDKLSYDKEISEMRTRVGDLENDAKTARLERDMFVRWARAVVEMLRQREISFPPPPLDVVVEPEPKRGPT